MRKTCINLGAKVTVGIHRSAPPVLVAERTVEASAKDVDLMGSVRCSVVVPSGFAVELAMVGVSTSSKVRLGEVSRTSLPSPQHDARPPSASSTTSPVTCPPSKDMAMLSRSTSVVGPSPLTRYQSILWQSPQGRRTRSFLHSAPSRRQRRPGDRRPQAPGGRRWGPPHYCRGEIILCT